MFVLRKMDVFEHGLKRRVAWSIESATTEQGK